MIIDWFSFTIKITDDKLAQDDIDREWHKDRVAGRRYEMLPAVLKRKAPTVFARLLGKAWAMEPRTPRAPYRWAMGTRTFTLFAHPDIDHVLIEVTGKGCKFLRDIGQLTDVIKRHAGTATRIDLAVDLPGVTPDEVVKAGVSGRFRARSRIESDKGTTIYIGSKKSERFARVYRYNEPHPRHGLCRVEIVNRKDYARALCDEIAVNGRKGASKAAFAVYEWEHPLLAQNAVEKLSGASVSKDTARTEYWLLKQAAPAFKRIVREGVIEDPVEWLQKHFLG